jgi:hypothetical protein
MYESKAKTTTIKVSSRASVKIRDNFFTVEYCEERTIPDVEGVNLEAEREFLWSEANKQVDDQIEEIEKIMRNPK